MSNSELILKGRLDGAQRTRLQSLLDMMYRPSEIADVVGFEVRQVYRVYLPLGCPHRRDDLDHIWINGKTFRMWYEETYPQTTLEDNEAFCLTCKRAVRIVDPQERKKGVLVYLVSVCPNCGRKLARILRQERDA